MVDEKVFQTKQGLIEDTLAWKGDIPYATLTKIETGVIKKPSVLVVSEIVKTLNVAIEYLIK